MTSPKTSASFHIYEDYQILLWLQPRRPGSPCPAVSGSGSTSSNNSEEERKNSTEDVAQELFANIEQLTKQVRIGSESET